MLCECVCVFGHVGLSVLALLMCVAGRVKALCLYCFCFALVRVCVCAVRVCVCGACMCVCAVRAYVCADVLAGRAPTNEATPSSTRELREGARHRSEVATVPACQSGPSLGPVGGWVMMMVGCASGGRGRSGLAWETKGITSGGVRESASGVVRECASGLPIASPPHPSPPHCPEDIR